MLPFNNKRPQRENGGRPNGEEGTSATCVVAGGG